VPILSKAKDSRMIGAGSKKPIILINTVLYRKSGSKFPSQNQKKNVVRGIHCSPYSKLVTCIKGRIWDVVVDLRKGSPTYLKWRGKELSPTQQLYIPPRCGHAFISLDEDNIVMYFQGGTWNPKFEMDTNYLDPQINIKWPKAEQYILSDKDRNAPFLDEAQKQWEERTK